VKSLGEKYNEALRLARQFVRTQDPRHADREKHQPRSRNVNLWEPNELQKINPIGKVPALRLDDGRVLISSPMIADYVNSTYRSPRFFDVTPR
jgi:glutathione S-transferase